MCFHGEPGGTIQARDAKTGEVLWQFQTGFGAEATADGLRGRRRPVRRDCRRRQSIQGSAYGDGVWAFSLKGQLKPLWPPPPPATVAGPGGAVADGVDKVKIGDNNVEYAYWPARTRVKAGTTVTFTNSEVGGVGGMAVILGGGWAGSSSFSLFSKRLSSGSGSV